LLFEVSKIAIGAARESGNEPSAKKKRESNEQQREGEVRAHFLRFLFPLVEDCSAADVSFFEAKGEFWLLHSLPSSPTGESNLVLAFAALSQLFLRRGTTMASVPAPSSRLRVAGSRAETTAGGGQRRRPLPRSSIVAAASVDASKPHADASSSSRLPLPPPPHDSERRDRGSEASTSTPSLPDTQQRWHRRLSELRTAVASAALAVALSASASTFASVAVVAPPPASAAEASALSAPNRTVPVNRAWLEGLVIEDTRAK
jgi:hypothetical protein